MPGEFKMPTCDQRSNQQKSISATAHMTMIRSIALVLLLLLLGDNAHGTAWRTNSAGNINTLASWRDVSTGLSTPANFTTAGDTWTIQNAMTQSAAWTVTGNVTLSSGSWATGANAVNFGGNFTNNVSSAAFTSSSTVTFNGTGAQTISGSAATTFSSLAINNASGVTLSGVGCTVTASIVLTTGSLSDGGNVITLQGNISGTGTHISTGSGKISMTGIGATIAGVTFGNLELNASSASAFTLTSSPTVNGTLTFTGASNTLTLGANTLTLKGPVAGMSTANYFTGNGASSNLTINSTANTGTIFFNPTTPGTTDNLATLTVNSAGYSVTLGNNCSILTTLILTAGTLNDGGHVITCAGNIQGAGTHVSGVGGKISMTGAAKSIANAAITFGNLDLNNAGGTAFTMGGNATIAGALSFTGPANTLTIGGYTLTLNGTVSGMTATQYLTGSASSNLTIGAAGALGTLYFNQTTPGTTNRIVTFTENGGGSATLGNNLVCSSALTLTSGSLAIGAGNTLTVNGAFSGSATGYLTGSTSSNLITGTSSTYFFDQTTPGTSNNIATFTASAGTTTLGNNLSISTGLTLTGTLADGGKVITCSGNITGAGIHTSSTGGMISLTGTNTTISGATFGNIQLNAASASAYSLTGSPTINGALTFAGANNTLTIGAFTLNLKGTVAGMSATQYLTGNGTNSNLTINSTSNLGTLFFNPTTPGTTDNIAVFTLNSAGFSATLGNNCSVLTTLALTAGTLNDNGNVLTLSGSITGTGTHISGTGGAIVMTGVNKSISGVTLGNLQFNSGSTSAFTNTGSPTVNGTLTFTGTANTWSLGAYTLTLNGAVSGMSATQFFTGSASSNLTIGTAGALGTLSFSQVTPGTSNKIATFLMNGGGTVTLGNNMVCGTALNLASGKLTIGGNTLTVSGTFTGSGTSYLTGGPSSNLITGTSSTYYFDQTTPGTSNNFAAFTASAGTTTLGNNVTIGTTLTLTGTLADGGNVITCAGNIAGTGTHTSTSGGKIIMTGIASTISAATLGNVQLNAGSASAFSLSGNATINGALTFTGANNTLTIGARTLTLKGTVSGMTATNYFTGSTSSNLTIGSTGVLGTLFFNQTTVGTTNKIVTFLMNGGGSATLGNNLVCQTALTLTAGQLAVGAGNTLQVNGSFTGSSVNYLTGGTTSNLTTGSSGVYYFDPTTPGISNNFAAYTAAAGTTSIGNNLSVGTTLTLTGTLGDGGNVITCAGNIAGTGTHTSTGSGKISMTGIGKTISAAKFGNLEFNASSASAFSLTGSPTINGSLIFTGANNTLTISTFTLTLKGTVSGMSATNYLTGGATSNLTVNSTSNLGTLFFNQTTPGTTNNVAVFTMNSAGFSATLGNNLSVLTTLALTAGTLSDGGNVISCAGNITGAGTHTSSTGGKISMTGAAKSISNSTATLGNIELNHAGATAFTMTGNPTITGAFSIAAAANTFSIGTHTLTLNGTVAGMSATQYFTGSATSNLVIGATGNLGTIYLNPTTAGTTNKIDTFEMIGGGTATIGNNMVSGTLLALNSGKFAIGAGATLTVNGTFTGTSSNCLTGGATSNLITGSSNTYYFDQSSPGTTNNFAAFTASAGTSTLGNALHIGTTLTLTGTLADGGNIVTCNGNIAGTGTESGTGGITMTGAGATISAATIQNLNLNNSGSFTLTGSPTVTGTLTLTAAKLTLGAINLNLGAAATAIGGTFSSSNLIVATGTGKVIKSYSSNGAFTFPIGDASNYTPVTLNVTGTYSAANMAVNVTAAKPAQNANTINYINRYWTVTPTGITSLSYSVTATYVPGDIKTGSTESNIAMGEYAGALPWIKFGAESAHTLTSGAVTSTGATIFSGINNASGPFPIVSANTTICTGSSTSLSAAGTTGDAPLTYTWLPATGLSATTGTPVTATPTVTTTYTLTVRDANGGTATATTLVSVNPVPSSTGATNNSPVCTGGSITLSDHSSNATAWLWKGPSAYTSTLQSPIITPTVTGVYSLTVSSAGTGCSPATVYTTTVTVGAQPSVSAVVSSAVSPICAGATMTLTATVAGGAGTGTYTWTGPGITTTTGSTNISPSFSPAASATGLYSVSLAYSGVGCTTASRATGTYSVITVPTVASVTSSITGLCVGSSVTLTAGAVSGTGTLSSYNWTGAGSYSSTTASGTPSVVVTPTVAATGAFSLTVTYPGTGCTSTIHTTSIVTVSATPTASPVNNGPVCAGGTATLSATPGTNTSKYTWTGPSTITTSTSQNPTVTPSVTGVYSLTVSDGTGRPGCSPAIIYTTTVALAPQPTVTALTSSATSPICAGATMTLTATVTAAVGIPTYHWSGPGIAATTSSSNVSPSFSPTVGASGAYSVTVNFASACATSASGTSGSFTVAAAPTVSGVTSSSNLLCTNGSFSLTAGSISGPSGGTFTSYNWSGPNGYSTTSAVNNVVFTPTVSAATGVYSLSVTYTGTGCTSGLSTTSSAVTVNTMPAAITGFLNICGTTGNVTNLTDAVSGGFWSSSATSVATVGSMTGVVTVVAPGITNIQYSVPGCTAVSATVTANAVTAGLCECTPSGSVNCGTGYYIAEVNVAGTTLDNVTTCGGGWSVFPYSSGSSTTANLSIPSTQNIGVRSGTSFGTDAIEAFIDYDQSNSFSAGEYIPITTAVNAANTVFNGTITVPSGATAGLTTLRVRYIGSGGSNGSGTACTSTGSTLGETEDYTICLSKVTTVNVSPASITNACIGGAPVLTVTATGSNLSYQWYTNSSSSVGGGTPTLIAGATNNTYTPATGTAGIYYYYCALTNICGITVNSPSTIAATVSVNPLPVSAGAGNSGPICAGLGSVTLSDNSTNATAWSWTGPGSYSSSLQNPVITPSVSGVYSLTVSSTGSGCSPATIYTTTVTVNTQPAPVSGTTTICNTLTTSLTDATAGGGWTSNDVTIATVGTDGTVTGTGAGTTSISYSIGGCASGISVTVNPYAPITGSILICDGGVTVLNDTASGGVWASSNTLIATVDSVTGVVLGISPGFVTITYSLGAGCNPSIGVLVSPAADTISGDMSVCAGNNTILSNTTTGGYWSTGATTVADISLFTGVVTGISAGTASITYSLPSGCNAYTFVTVNPIPGTITGTNSMCTGLTTTLSDASGGGTWSTADATVATIGSASGIVTSVAAGTTFVTYSLATGCVATRSVSVNALPATVSVSGGGSYCVSTTITGTNGGDGTIYFQGTTSGGTSTVTPTGTQTITTTGTYYFRAQSATGCWGNEGSVSVTINPLPGSITGTAALCAGTTTALTDATTGGTWSSSNAAHATVGSASGIVTGVVNGTANITYTATTGCTAIQAITVNPISAISGSSSVCAGSTITLSDATTGGTWSSSNTAAATIGSTTGIVLGIASGTASITYTLPTGCLATAIITVNGLPAAITGTGVVCAGLTTNLTDATGSGTWSSSNTGIATVGAATGIVSGVASGTAAVTYLVTSGCKTATVVTVNAVPGVINGAASVCTGLTTSLSDATAGGTWSSSDGTLATIGSTGIVSGVASGMPVITYTLATGCIRTTIITVNQLASITGSVPMCAGSTVTFADAVSGGTWNSGNTGVATVAVGSGIVTGVAAGTAMITYLLPSGCRSTSVATVNAVPTLINGAASVCMGLTTSLSDATTGGTWSSSDVTLATIGTSGIVTGIAAGTPVMTYTLASGCGRTAVVTVNPLSPITGSVPLCPGTTLTLNDATTSGVWSSSAIGVATVGATTGTVSGVAAGTSTITYLSSTGCKATTVITVNSLPSAITGTGNVCVGSSLSLSDAASGGTWSSSNTSLATVGSTGIVTGNGAGIPIISYTAVTGCSATTPVTVNPVPVSITGSMVLCAGSVIHLADAAAGGTWSSSATSVATVDAAGNVMGITGGTATISYIMGAGCYSTATVTVNAILPITGTLSACIGSTTLLADGTSGGTWASSNTSVATIGSSGLLTGVASGTVTISYAIATGCVRTATVAVNATPSAILGSGIACIGYTSSLSDAVSGGTWSSSAPFIASVSSAGIITGASAGNATMYYVSGSGCYVSKVVTVNANPSGIGGPSAVCPGAVITLIDFASGGTWSSSNGNATIDGTSGNVTGISAGTSTMSYIISSTGCFTTYNITINTAPLPIGGVTTVCAGLVTFLSDATSGGISWHSDNTSVATISGSGGVTGISAGTANITYMIADNCTATTVVTVNPLPSAITNNTSVCAGSSLSLSDGSAGGTWTSSNAGVATIGSASGLLAGVTSGTSTITYTLGTGCKITTVATVNPILPITGNAPTCAGHTLVLSCGSPGGIWASDNTSVATVGSTGIVTGLGSGGTANISYTIPSGCVSSVVVTINQTPSAINGPGALCFGSTITLTDGTPGGSWSSSAPFTASIGSSGVITTFGSGATTIYYTTGAGCYTTAPLTVNPLPSGIGGSSTVCLGTTITLSDFTAGGNWSSSNSNISVDGSGNVSGLVVGSSTITYTLPTGCLRTYGEVVNPLPAPISGTLTVCEGSTTFVSDAVTPALSWTTSNTAIATAINSGAVTGVSAGTAILTYAIYTGCITTAIVTVYPLPAVITGSAPICLGGSLTLSDATAGGTWSSAYTPVATIGSTTGVVSTVAPGTAFMLFTIATGCSRSAMITVNPIYAISGNSPVCMGQTITLTDTAAGGTWSISDPAIASVDPGTGIVTSANPGTAVITYSLSTGCSATTIVTVTSAISGVMGAGVTCGAPSTLTLSDATAGGMWSSGDLTVATVNGSTGVVSGVSAGIVNITYSAGAGCVASAMVTINQSPSSLNGITTVCTGLTTALSDATPDGTWSTSDPTIAYVGSYSGIVTGAAGGTVNISYTISNGCYNFTTVTVNPLVSLIAGATLVCVGATDNLTDATTGGTWSSSNPAVAAIGSTGQVTGIAGGGATITYSAPTGCVTAFNVVVNPYAGIISGISNVDIGGVTSLTDIIGGGAWTISNGNATIDSVGDVTGITAGTSTVSYTINNVCGTDLATLTVTVNASVAPVLVSGGGVFCGSTTITADNGGDGTIYFQGTTSGGTSTVTPSSSQLITTSGTYYFRAMSALGSWGMEGSAVVTINPIAGPITGTRTVCAGMATNLTDAGGGTWTSGNAGVASIGSATGIVSGNAAGTATVTYTLGTGCITTNVITVNSIPAAITGAAVLCNGSTTSLTDITVGGTWSSDDGSIASVGTSGVVTSVAAGNTVITYMLPTGCVATAPITVNVTPASITGNTSICAGSTTGLTDVTSGGTWSSSAPPTASVNSSGLVTSGGAITGTVTITYDMGAGCLTSTTITINALPSAITGATSICPGSITNLTDAGGGSWSSNNTSVATIGSSTGIATGIAAGSTRITYTALTGCSAIAVVTVNTLPTTVTASASGTYCGNATITASNGGSGTIYFQGTTSGGTSTAIPGASQVVSVSGTYYFRALSVTGCWGNESSVTVTINPLPAAITGASSLCAGFTTSLTDATAGGTWTSGSISIATIGSTGIVTGVSSGTSAITYTSVTGCAAVMSIIVNPLPAAISGANAICAGVTTPFSDASLGGTWISSNTAVATIGSATGVATGVSGGAATITYILSTGCTATGVLTVNALPTAVTVSGSGTYCNTTTITAANGGSGTIYFQGTTSGGTSTATPSGSQVITSSGTYYFRALSAGGCWGPEGSATVTINPLPAALSGGTLFCVGTSFSLTDASGGGTWSSSNGAVATIGSATGLLSSLTTGTSNITYTLPTGCHATTTVSVLALPAAVSGASSVCLGANTMFSDATAGGTWSSSNSYVATVGSTGVVTGQVTGNANIIYTTGAGCTASASVTVNPLPSAIIGATGMCLGAPYTLTNGVSGGNWSSSNTAVATIGSGGVVDLLSAGTSAITYTLPTGCFTSAVITLNPVPAAITGTTSICSGAISVLTDANTGGAWATSDATIANVSAGAVTGIVAGTAVITYSLSSGCYTTTVFTVNQSPAAISGATAVCQGLTTALTNTVAGGVWSSSNTGIAGIGTSGSATGVSAGTVNISYALGSCTTTVTITVNPIAAISGNIPVCAGNTVSLSDAASGGVWTSGTISIASVGSSGVVTGLNAGTSAISYVLPSGCNAVAVVTVNQLPLNITGGSSVCAGLSITLGDFTSGGTWSSNDVSIASVASASGVVSGIAAGTTTITYTLGTGCYNTTGLTVNPFSSITGSLSLCIGSSTNLTDASSGGTWSSSNVLAATIGTSGIVTALAVGTTTISYTLPSGCMARSAVTVNPFPSAITGNMVACVGSTSALTEGSTGGTWTSGATSIATISTGGVISGVAAGNAVITYTLPTGCMATTTVTINAVPTTINGSHMLCAGSTTTLTDAIMGGTWSSSNAANAIIDQTSGTMTAIAGGTTTITYTMAAGCFITTVVTVNAISPITGTLSACIGATTALADSSVGGTWSSSNTSVASIGTSGIVTGIASGTTVISYTIPGCVRTATVAVNLLSGAIGGVQTMCVGTSTTLTTTGSGGTWSSGAVGIVSVSGSSGIVTGVSAGTAVVTYTSGSGCYSTAVVTVNPSPSGIGGLTSVCIGSSITVSDFVSGGTWSSSNGNAVIGSVTGIVTGVTAGTSSITYSLSGTGCYVTYGITVKSLPSSISGPSTVCIGAVGFMTDATSGAVSWLSSNTSVATITYSGAITGVANGTTTITYTITSGCFATAVVTVNSVSTPINGNTPLCAGTNILLSDATAGGTWASSNATIATIGSSTGIVTGIAGGTATISYLINGGCSITSVVTVNPIQSIAGSPSACVGSNTVLADATPGGTWGSSNTSIATIGSASGLVTGVAAGTAIITYSIPSGCFIMTTVNISAMTPITGPANICMGSSAALTEATAGGLWSSNAPFIASVNSSGLVTSVAAGIANITYAIAGCNEVQVVTVNPSPSGIVGTSAICIGANATVSDFVAGGTWSSSNTNAAIGSSTGIVTGMYAGISTLTYSLATGCYATFGITVNSVPLPIAGSGTVCVGSVAFLTDATSGAVSWTSSNTSDATVSYSGAMTGIAAGTATITYTISNGCTAIKVITVNAVPTVAPITGTLSVIAGSTVTLYDATTGGTWTSGNTIAATIDASSGVLTGVNHGSSIVTYTVTNSSSCYAVATALVTVSAYAPHSGGPAAPSIIICAGSSVTLEEANAGGTFSSSDYNIAVVDDASGLVTGISPGIVTISYTQTSGFGTNTTTELVEVDPLPGVNITADPGTNILPGETVTLQAVATNAGASPIYEWSINGAVINGATSAFFVSNSFSDNDSVTCEVVSSGTCSGYVTTATAGINVRALGTGVINTNDNIVIGPNPSQGEFAIKGRVDPGISGEALLEITDLLGQVVYKKHLITSGGMIDEKISLIGTLTNGMYILSVETSNERYTIHFVIEK